MKRVISILFVILIAATLSAIPSDKVIQNAANDLGIQFAELKSFIKTFYSEPSDNIYGEFRLGKQTYDNIIQAFANQYSGMDSVYAAEIAKAETSYEDFLEEFNHSIIIKKDGIIFDGEFTEGIVSKDDNNILSLSVNNKSVPFGQISSDLNTIRLMGDDLFVFERVN